MFELHNSCSLFLHQCFYVIRSKGPIYRMVTSFAWYCPYCVVQADAINPRWRLTNTKYLYLSLYPILLHNSNGCTHVFKDQSTLQIPIQYINIFTSPEWTIRVHAYILVNNVILFLWFIFWLGCFTIITRCIQASSHFKIYAFQIISNDTNFFQDKQTEQFAYCMPIITCSALWQFRKRTCTFPKNV